MSAVKRRRVSQNDEVSTVAGSGAGFVDGQGTAAHFKNPTGVAVDSEGNIIVADHTNHRIRKITPGGAVSTLAGSGAGFADGQGTAALVRSPTGVVVGSEGDIIVADGSNHRIRKITPGGAVSTLAGSACGFADGQGTAALFRSPTGVAVDNEGNIIVADHTNHRVRKITPGGAVSTLAGSGAGFADGQGTAALFRSPTGVAVDSEGDIIVADQQNHHIRKITPGGADVSTLAGSAAGFADGQGTTALFRSPTGVAVDNEGNIIVADNTNHRICKITPGGADVSTLAGSAAGFADGQGTAALFRSPSGVAVDGEGNIIVADQNNHRIRTI
jgi:DNA-binding beta-propeller fold protein YncE